MFSRFKGQVLARRNKSNASISGSKKGKQKAFEIDGRIIIWSVVFTADGNRILVGGAGSKIRCWGTDDGKEVTKTMDAGDVVYNIAVSQDGKWIVSGGGRGTASARVFDAESGELVTELKGHRGAVGAVDVSLDGTRIATGSDDQTARIWSLSTGNQLQRLPHHCLLAAAKFSPNGRLLATATYSSVQIYECESGRLLTVFKIFVAFLRNQSVAWHHDSNHLFVASSDGHIHHLDVLTGNTLSEWRIHSYGSPGCIALASDSTYIAVSAGRSVSFWNAVTHQEIGSPIWNMDTVRSMAISADHDVITSVDETVTVRNLREFLPAPYCNNTARNLQADLKDLQHRYKAQLHVLRQITALEAELDRWKRAVAIKTDKLSAVRRELDQLPDLSHEVVVARNELRWSEARTHDIHQWYNHQLRDITSAVASSQPGLPTVHQSITDSDASAKKAIVRTFDELNAAIQRTSMTVSTYFVHHIKPPNTSEQSSAARRASNSIPQSLVDRLLTLPPHNLPLYLPIALRVCLTSYLYTIISSWTGERRRTSSLGKCTNECANQNPTCSPPVGEH
ncbi:WD40-repeat-containing domain protein [Chiua virens]|nr:WD40-repeat-containing domain protein [Chiua virens]